MAIDAPLKAKSLSLVYNARSVPEINLRYSGLVMFQISVGEIGTLCLFELISSCSAIESTWHVCQ